MEHKARIIYCGIKKYSESWEIVKDKIKERYSESGGYDINFSGDIYFENIAEFDYKEKVSELNPSVAVIDIFGIESLKNWEDTWERFVSLTEFLVAKGIRPIIINLPPYSGCLSKIRKYNKAILNYCTEKQIRVADIYEYYQNGGLRKCDYAFADKAEAACFEKALIPVLIRTKMLVLWQFNGRYAHCNYACPYCYVATSVNKGMHFNYDITKWEEAFSRHFEGKDVVFYFSYGEPMMAGNIFYDVLEMIGRHSTWQVRMTSNVSLSMDRLLNSEIVKQGRLFVNASFHPTQIGIDDFIAQCDTLRAGGIDPSVIYVMYPDQIDDFPKYMEKFREKGYRVHIRAFRGLYHGKKYPQAYTKKQWEATARYMDRANFKYQLHAVNGLGRMSMLGMTHILIDNYGKIEMCDSYVGDRRYGNIFDENINLDVKPYPFPGLVPLAAVDDIADYTEVDYDDLEGNNVNCYNTQGGVIVKDDGSIEYPYEYVDFGDSKLIKELKKVPKPFKTAASFWFNPKWFFQHFVYSFVIKKYGKYVFAWIKGKWRLLKAGKLRRDNFWHG